MTDSPKVLALKASTVKLPEPINIRARGVAPPLTLTTLGDVASALDACFVPKDAAELDWKQAAVAAEMVHAGKKDINHAWRAMTGLLSGRNMLAA